MKSKLKVSFLVLIGTLLVFSVTLIIGAEEEKPVEFKNRAIELLIGQKVGKAVKNIYLSDLKKVERLSLNHEDIEDISVLQYCKNLEYLSLVNNNISDITPLSKLQKLRDLDLTSNIITDIQPLVDNFKAKEDGKNMGLGEGDSVELTYNRLDLSKGSEDLQNIQTLQDRGVEVEYYPQMDYNPDEESSKETNGNG